MMTTSICAELQSRLESSTGITSYFASSLSAMKMVCCKKAIPINTMNGNFVTVMSLVLVKPSTVNQFKKLKIVLFARRLDPNDSRSDSGKQSSVSSSCTNGGALLNRDDVKYY